MTEAERLSKIIDRMARIDALTPELRELVHDYGYTVVHAFLDQKITKANVIRHLIQQTLRGSLDVGTSVGSKGWLQAGRQMVVVPLEPTPVMIQESMATVANHDMVLDKYDKHKLRLRAAIKVGVSKYV